MKLGVITFPGSNCDQDLIYVLRELMGHTVLELWHKDTDLQGVDVVFVPGGFTYGDYLRTGAIARFSPIMQEVVKHADRGGYVMGICNGFQILTEAGLLPGALMRNAGMQFVCDNVWLSPVSKSAAPTRALEQRAYKIPIAHGEGNYFCDADTLKQLEDKDQILFRYVTPEGQSTTEANPNGSLNNIAGVMNAKGNVFGMMPHPERAADTYLGNTDGLAILKSVLV
jgi:phosphoribosylformylglycinamidine synthase subunit PurQ / glutaminase